MAIYDEVIRNEMRSRIINYANIFTEDDFKFENRNFNPENRRLWISEAWIGGDEEVYTNRRTQMPTAIVQYDIYAKENTGTMEAGTAAHAIEDEFSILSPIKSRIVIPNFPNMDVVVYKTGLSTRKESPWFVQIIVLYLRIIQLCEWPSG